MGLFCGISLLFIGMLGLWDSAMITLSIMGVSVLISVAIALPLGIAAASNDRFESSMRPVLDTLQVMPAFVWLMPALFSHCYLSKARLLSLRHYKSPLTVQLIRK